MPVLEGRTVPSSLFGGYMPIMDTKPPSGMALKPYSVSPFLRDQSVGPKPIMYLVTRTLNSLAGSRWPTSCRAMDTAMPIATKTTPRIKRRTGLMLGSAAS